MKTGSAEQKGSAGESSQKLIYKIIPPDLKIEVGQFFRNMLMNEGNNVMTHKSDQIHCTLCLQTKEKLMNMLPVHYLLSHLKHQSHNNSMKLGNTEEIFSSFMKGVANADELLERHKIIRANQISLKRIGDNQDPSQNSIPTVLQWSLGYLETDELISKFSNNSFLSADLKVCDSCYLKYTKQ